MTYDAVIVGAGPAGLTASLCLNKLGLTVAVIDEQPAPGGQIWRGAEKNAPSKKLKDALGDDYAQGFEVVKQFREAAIEYFPETQVWHIEDGWKIFLSHKGEVRSINARTILLATGAQERPFPFPGWTLSGVMTVGAAQILLKTGGMVPEGKIWMVGSGPLPLLYATQLNALGVEIEGYLNTDTGPVSYKFHHFKNAWKDVSSLLKGLKWIRRLKADKKLISGVSNIDVTGDDRVEHISWTSGGKTHQYKADLVLAHDGVVPRVHETLSLKCKHLWNAGQAYFYPEVNEWGETSRAGLFVAGDGSSIKGWKAAVASGEIAALGIYAALKDKMHAKTLRNELRSDKKLDAAVALRPLLDAIYPPRADKIPDDTIVCRCEEVDAGTIRAATEICASDIDAVKAYTRCGMGPCQGRQCAYTVQKLVAETKKVPITDIKFYNVRPPLKSITLAEVASLENNEGA